MAAVQRPVGPMPTNEQQLGALTEALAQLGWDEDTQVKINILDQDTVVLVRRRVVPPPPEGWAAHFAGKLGHVFGDHDEIMAYLDEERRSWEPEESDDAR